MQQIQTLTEHIKTQLNKNNKNSVNDNIIGGGKKVTRSHFGNNSTDELMVHTINKRIVVSTSNKPTKTMQHLTNKSMRAIIIVTIVI